MTQSSILEQSTFSSGEVSPPLYARVDLQRYTSSLRLCKNMFVKAEGGVTKRPGTKLVAPTKNSTGGVRLIEFEPTTTDTYVIEFGDLYARFHKDGDVVFESATTTVTGVSDGSPNAVFASTGHSLSDGDYVKITSVDVVGTLTGRFCIVDNAGANDFELTDWETGDPVLYAADMSGVSSMVVSVVYEIATPYTAAQVGAIKVTQSVDVLYLAHPDHEPRKMTRTALTPTFQIDQIFFNERLATPSGAGTATWASRAGGGTPTFPNGYGSETYVITAVDTTGTYAESLPSDEFSGPRDSQWASANQECEISLNTLNGGAFQTNSDAFNVYKRVGGVFLFIGQTKVAAFKDPNLVPAITASSPPKESDFFAQTLTYSTGGAGSGTPTLGEIITGQTSGATARIVTVAQGATGVSGTIVVTPLSGVLVVGEDIDGDLAFGGAVNPPDIDTITTDYPSVVTFFEDRLCWAASALKPQTVWTSQSGDYQNLTKSQVPIASDALEFTINARQLNKIFHMAALDRLLLMTSGAVWSASGAGDNEPIAPDNIRVRVQSYNGVEDVAPIFFDDSVIYLEDKAQTVRDLRYEFTSDKYSGNDLSVLARHLFDGYTVLDWCRQQVPYGLIWAARDDGTVLCLTYLREHDVRGWSQHTIGDAVTSMASISGSSEDDVYMVVERGTRRHIEILQSRQYGTDIKDAWFVDDGASGSIYNGKEVHGLWHLEGETLSALVDGNVEEGLVVSDGSVTLTNAPATKVVIGVPFTGEMTTLDINAGANGGSLQAQRRRVSKIFVRLEDTRGVFGSEDGTSPLNELKQQLYIPDSPIDTVSGIVEIVPASEWGRQGRVHLEFPYPLPAEVTAIMPEITVGS